MINFVEGTLVEGGTEAVVAVGGAVGLDVQLSAHGAAQLPPAGRPVRLWTHLSVREDHWSLFGFVEEAERAMFRLLISVSGVGPKVALGMLSGARASEIALFLRTGDEKALVGLPGIGKKSAARLVVELGNRVPEQAGGGGAGSTAAEAEGPRAEAAAVLGAMGLSPAVADQALTRALREDAAVAEDVGAWVKAALRNL